MHLQAAIAFEGGEAVALQRLKHYLWDTGAISTYFDMRNGMLGADYSTKFSPWLARGCISPCTIYHEAKPCASTSSSVLPEICPFLMLLTSYYNKPFSPSKDLSSTARDVCSVLSCTFSLH